MEKKMFCIFLFSGLCHFTFSYQRPLYHFINNPKDWLTAQQYCRDMYTDLATITDEQDLEDLAGLVGSGGPFVYLGLYRDWGWSVSENDDYKEGEPAYWNWASGEPSVQSCASMSATGGWYATPCNSTLSFFCYTALATDVSERFVLITNTMDWLSAQSYCRATYTDLARVQNQQENDLLQALVTNQQVWIGLTRMSWRWSDGSEPSFIPWGLSVITSAQLSDCGVLEVSSNPLGMVQRRYAEKQPFICYTAPRKKTLVQMQLSADVDMTDPGVRESVLKWVKNNLGGTSDDLNVSWWKPPEKKYLLKHQKCPP
ncbi:C-type mannose receptor 2-like [Maylandia zebra]|uniref:C-type mannose receptor 2-like n=1 Tax=Maylandia zebra TaxID=106582 RepID=UPI00032A3E14